MSVSIQNTFHPKPGPSQQYSFKSRNNFILEKLYNIVDNMKEHNYTNTSTEYYYAFKKTSCEYYIKNTDSMDQQQLEVSNFKFDK